MPVILSYKSTADSINGIKETVFKISSFTEQKYEVTLLQQSLATVLNEYLPEWTLEIFKKGFGLDNASDTYRRHLILKCESGSTGKSTIARLLAFRLSFRNYISHERFPAEKRRNSIMYFLSRFKRQVVILDLVRRPFAKADIKFVKKKVSRAIEKEVRVLEETTGDTEFLRKINLTLQNYDTQVEYQKSEILSRARKRLASEVRNSSIMGSAESEKMRTFLEMFRQGCTTEEQYFFHMSS